MDISDINIDGRYTLIDGSDLEGLFLDSDLVIFKIPYSSTSSLLTACSASNNSFCVLNLVILDPIRVYLVYL